MSAPAILAEACARRVAAHAVLAEALHTPQEAAARAAADQADQAADAARAAADSLAQPAILAAFAYHHVAVPPPDAFTDLLSAMHEQTFTHLAEISDSRFDYSNGLLLALRRAWRRHHGRLADGLGDMDDDSTRRVLHCTRFGEVASVLEDERQVSDQIFGTIRNLWRILQGRGSAPAEDPHAPGPRDSLSPPPAYPIATPIPGPSRLPPLCHSPLPDYQVDPGHSLSASAPAPPSPTYHFAPSNSTSETGSTTSGSSDAAEDATSALTIRIPAPTPTPRLIIRIPSRNATQTITDWDGTGSETGSSTTGATDSTAEWDEDDDYVYESAGGEDE